MSLLTRRKLLFLSILLIGIVFVSGCTEETGEVARIGEATTTTPVTTAPTVTTTIITTTSTTMTTTIAKKLEILSHNQRYNEYGWIVILGEVKNIDTKPVKGTIYLTLYDSSGNVIASESTHTDPWTIQPGQTRSFERTWTDETIISAFASYKIYTEFGEEIKKTKITTTISPVTTIAPATTILTTSITPTTTPTYTTTTTTSTIPATTTSPKTWNGVTSFSGAADKTTDTFYIPGNKWRFTWGCTSTQPEEYQLLSIFAYPEGETAMYVAVVSFAKCSQGDTVYVYEGPGEYYFKVLTANLDSWSITVESYH